MKRVLRILKFAALAAAVLLAAGVTYLFAYKPMSNAPARLTIERTPERLERGRYIYTLADCDGCHSDRDFTRFGGPVIEGRRGAGAVFPKEMGLPGLIAPPNITPDPETGIGNWTDGEKIRAIREGVSRDGHPLFPMMPYQNFRHMSDEDVYSLVAYLDSMPAVHHQMPRTRVSFPASVLMKSAPQPVGRVAQPDRRDRRKYGEYLVTVAGCRDCHTETFGGGQRFQIAPGVAVVSANISPDQATGIGKWSEDYFVDRFRQYREYAVQGPPPAGPSSFTVMPWLNLTLLPENDLRAIYAFVSSRKPVAHAVETHPGFDPETPAAASQR